MTAASDARWEPHVETSCELVGPAPEPPTTLTDPGTRRCAGGAHNVRFHRTDLKKMHHPVVGQLDLAYEGLELPADPGLTLFVLTAEPASATADRLKLLASWAATNELENITATDTTDAANAIKSRG